MVVYDLRNLVSSICYNSDDMRFQVALGVERHLPKTPPSISYPAAQALWHLLGNLRHAWEPMSLRLKNGLHCYLRHRSGLVTLDPASFERDAPLHYRYGVQDWFITSWPCGRAIRIMERCGFAWPLDSGESICPACRGAGEIPVSSEMDGGRFPACSKCGGTGVHRALAKTPVINS